MLFEVKRLALPVILRSAFLTWPRSPTTRRPCSNNPRRIRNAPMLWAGRLVNFSGLELAKPDGKSIRIVPIDEPSSAYLSYNTRPIPDNSSLLAALPLHSFAHDVQFADWTLRSFAVSPKLPLTRPFRLFAFPAAPWQSPGWHPASLQPRACRGAFCLLPAPVPLCKTHGASTFSWE